MRVLTYSNLIGMKKRVESLYVKSIIFENEDTGKSVFKVMTNINNHGILHFSKLYYSSILSDFLDFHMYMLKLN
jgi:hypothetical protein